MVTLVNKLCTLGQSRPKDVDGFRYKGSMDGF
jgi:hypothetical protein